MVNTRVKGSKIQLKCQVKLESCEYLVAVVERKGKFIKIKDMYGLFDLVAIKKGECLFIQVTCNRPHTHKPYLKFSKDYANNGIKFMQYVWYDRKGWVIWEYKWGNKLKLDLRK